MKCLPSNISADDINQWLGGGWFLAKRDADSALEPAMLTTHDGEWEWKDMSDGVHRLVKDFAFPHWPQCGAVNLEGYAVVVERRQSRQYRRTYNDRCVAVHTPRKWDVMKKFGTEAGTLTANHDQVVRAVFSPVYYTYGQAVQKIEQERWLSVALNSHLVIAGCADEYLVYYRNKLIGKISNGRITPLGTQAGRIRRIIKFFEGRVTL